MTFSLPEDLAKQLVPRLGPVPRPISVLARILERSLREEDKALIVLSMEAIATEPSKRNLAPSLTRSRRLGVTRLRGELWWMDRIGVGFGNRENAALRRADSGSRERTS